MDGLLSERCAFLAEVWEWWAQTLRTVDESAWLKNTRLEGWNVAALVAHHSVLVYGLGFLAARPVDAEAQTTSAGDMLRHFNEPGGLASEASGVIAEMARQQAASSSTAELAAVFTDTAPQVLSAIQTAEPVVVDYFGNGTFPLTEAVSIATMEAVVHGLDLCAALDLDSQLLPAAATRSAVTLLASIADPVQFIEAATGRVGAPVLPVVR